MPNIKVSATPMALARNEAAYRLAQARYALVHFWGPWWETGKAKGKVKEAGRRPRLTKR
jgi:hypothetical protein